MQCLHTCYYSVAFSLLFGIESTVYRLHRLMGALQNMYDKRKTLLLVLLSICHVRTCDTITWVYHAWVMFRANSTACVNCFHAVCTVKAKSISFLTPYTRCYSARPLLSRPWHEASYGASYQAQPTSLAPTTTRLWVNQSEGEEKVFRSVSHGGGEQSVTSSREIYNCCAFSSASHHMWQSVRNPKAQPAHDYDIRRQVTR